MGKYETWREVLKNLEEKKTGFERLPVVINLNLVEKFEKELEGKNEINDVSVIIMKRYLCQTAGSLVGFAYALFAIGMIDERKYKQMLFEIGMETEGF